MIMHGVTGSGKSTVSRELAAALGAIWLRSDAERSRLQVPPDDETGVDRGRYSAPARKAVYDRLLRLSAEIIDSGFAVIVDATFLKAAQRERFRTLAAEKQIPFLIIEASADEAELRARVGRRMQRRDDPSEADLEVLEHHLKTQEPLRGPELANALLIESGQEILIAEIKRRCDRRR
jgi:uncharacterized protein